MGASNAWTATGTVPHGPHRMADPRIRVRTMLAVAALVAATWGTVATLGEPGCAAYSEREVRELAGLPVPPACVQMRLPPANPNVLPGANP